MSLSSVEPASTAAADAVRLARESGYGVAFAESLTGGLCASTFIAVPGASAVVRGGVVAYATDLKNRILGVDQDVLDRFGPVAEPVAIQMASGVRALCAEKSPAVPNSSAPSKVFHLRENRVIGISTTGVAGPEADAQTGQRPGTVWIGVSSHRGSRASLFTFRGSRQQIREQTVAAAIQLLRQEILAVK